MTITTVQNYKILPAADCHRVVEQNLHGDGEKFYTLFFNYI